MLVNEQRLINEQRAGEMVPLTLTMEELESLDAPWSWTDFSAGVGVGFGGIALVGGGIAIT
jgi:hypothetical protein